MSSFLPRPQTLLFPQIGVFPTSARPISYLSFVWPQAPCSPMCTQRSVNNHPSDMKSFWASASGCVAIVPPFSVPALFFSICFRPFSALFLYLRPCQRSLFDEVLLIPSTDGLFFAPRSGCWARIFFVPRKRILLRQRNVGSFGGIAFLSLEMHVPFSQQF